MSRAERRQYQRMMKGQDPYALPPKSGGRPPRRPRAGAPRDWSFNRGFWVKSVLVAAVVGVIGLSLVWSSGAQTAALAGLGAAAAVIAVLVGLRLLLRRAAAR